MLNKLAQLGAWIVAAIAGIWWLRSDAKRDAKLKSQSEADRELLKRAEQANAIEQEVRSDSAYNRRERLRQHSK